ncbi:hypothetical protein LTR62_008285 [Meristemomyces frigidus]|uniref:Pentatricopeptide repeat domain-containing protein n=1 Tax=Meristemomyces frigidus TaxID=1508187 RepID=A0AAN7TAT7_9PEZI|nr:hypothetical protein LTR62_008285 [Meristemomyces frigidus]
MRFLPHLWLARPLTSQLGRRLLVQRRAGTTGRILPQRKHIANSHKREHEAKIDADLPWIRCVDTANTNVTELLGASIHEYSLRASLNTGVLLVPEATDVRASFYELKRQADVSNEVRVGKLLVDEMEHRDNYKLWAELLQFRHRLNGAQGVIDVWDGMRRRGIDLPTDGDEADVLWSELIKVACEVEAQEKHHARNMLKDLINHAVELKQRTDWVWKLLHRSVVGQLLAVDAAAARQRHQTLSAAGMVPEDALKHVVDFVLHNANPVVALSAFKRMYNKGTERDCYDTAIPLALKLRGAEHALLWHRMFLRQGDAPSQAIFALSEVQQLFSMDKNRSLPMIGHPDLKRVQKLVNVEDLARQKGYLPLTRASMSAIVGDVHGIKPKEIGDSFIAKMFATSAFPLDLIIRGLSFFSVEQLGPLALREMAVRAGSPVELCNKLAELKPMGIKLADTAYCRLVRKLASDGHTDPFNTLLASDQHPESYDDTETQEALLASYLEKEEWARANVTMTCLTLSGKALERRAVNLLAQHYLRAQSWRLLHSTIQTMQSQKIAPVALTLKYLHRYLLPERRRGKAPVNQPRPNRPTFRPLDFVTNVCIYSQDLNGNVPSHMWVELLKRYGMAHRWPQLEKLVLWLSAHGSMRARHRSTRSGGRSSTLHRDKRQLDEVFTEAMQQAIFVWGFNNAALRQQLIDTSPMPEAITGMRDLVPDSSPIPVWAQGLALLRQMRERRVPISNDAIRRAVRTRLWILFGPGTSFKAFNELARKVNRLELSDYLRQGKGAYGRSIVEDLHPELLDDDTPNQALLKLAFFGEGRQASSNTFDDSTTPPPMATQPLPHLPPK